jgi:hypothetical protein
LTAHISCDQRVDFKSRASVSASLEQKQRLQQLFFPNGIAFDGKAFVGTRVTAPAFSYLREIRTENEGLVDQTGIEPVTS